MVRAISQFTADGTRDNGDWQAEITPRQPDGPVKKKLGKSTN
jgi:hypothetical protein